MILDFDRLMYPPDPNKQGSYRLEQISKAYRDVFSSENGKIVLNDIAQRGLLHTVSFMGEAALSTAFNEGKRALALEIIRLLNPNPIHNIIGESDDSPSPLEFD